MSTRSEAAQLTTVASSLAAALAPQDVLSLTDDDLISATRELEVLARKVAALRYAAAAEIDTRSKVPDLHDNLAFRHGCRNSIELLQRLTLSSRSCAARHVRRGKQLAARQGFSGEVLEPEYPVISAALTAGMLSEESATTILATIEHSKHRIPAAEIPVSERYLVAAATGGLTHDGVLPPNDDESPSSPPEHADEIRVRSRALAMYFDQDGPEPSIDESRMRRGFRFGTERDGLIPVSGALLPETAALLARLFDSINSPRTDANPAPRLQRSGADESFDRYNKDEYVPFDAARHGGKVRFMPVSPADATDVDYVNLHATDPRSGDQKRHDALAVLLSTAAKHPETPLLGGAPVTVLIQATAESLDPAARSGAAWLHDHNGSHSPISRKSVRHAACAGGMQKITQAPNGRIIGIESPSRVFTAHQRRAIMLRDGGCIIPGCTVPSTWCEIHHVDEWANGGKTHTDNGVLLCFHHHRYLESSGWHIRMRDGVPQVRPPTWVHGNSLWWRVEPATRPPNLRDVA